MRCWICDKEIKGEKEIFKCGCDEKCPLVFCKECVDREPLLVYKIKYDKYIKLKELKFFEVITDV